MTRRGIALLTALFLAPSPLVAAPGGPKSKPPKPQATVSKPVKSSTPKIKPVSANTSVGKSHVAKPVKVSKPSNAVKPVKTKPVQTTKAAKTTSPAKTTKLATKPDKTTKLAKVDSKKSAPTTDPTATPAGGTTTPTGGDTVPLTKVQEKLQRNANLASKLQGRLPEGTDLMTAAAGFKNLGQFVAAVNVSNNLDLPFTQLKTLMVDEGYSLGQSIQKVKADVNAPLEAQRAETDANRLIASTEVQVTTTKAKSSKKQPGAQQ